MVMGPVLSQVWKMIANDNDPCVDVEKYFIAERDEKTYQMKDPEFIVQELKGKGYVVSVGYEAPGRATEGSGKDKDMIDGKYIISVIGPSSECMVKAGIIKTYYDSNRLPNGYSVKLDIQKAPSSRARYLNELAKEYGFGDLSVRIGKWVKRLEAVLSMLAMGPMV